MTTSLLSHSVFSRRSKTLVSGDSTGRNFPTPLEFHYLSLLPWRLFRLGENRFYCDMIKRRWEDACGISLPLPRWLLSFFDKGRIYGVTDQKEIKSPEKKLMLRWVKGRLMSGPTSSVLLSDSSQYPLFSMIDALFRLLYPIRSLHSPSSSHSLTFL